MKNSSNNTNQLRKVQKELNAVKSVNWGEWFGNYKGVEWVITTLKKDGEMWYYLKDSIDGENLMPAKSLREAFLATRNNIDYELS